MRESVEVLPVSMIWWSRCRAEALLRADLASQERGDRLRLELIRVHLPRNWPWESAWNTLFNKLYRHNTPILA
jgi:hypothetical protein